MQAVAGLCLLLFVVVSTLVGVRVLVVARRTRRRPELLMGTGMVLIGGVGYPSTILAGFGGTVGELNVAALRAAAARHADRDRARSTPSRSRCSGRARPGRARSSPSAARPAGVAGLGATARRSCSPTPRTPRTSPRAAGSASRWSATRSASSGRAIEGFVHHAHGAAAASRSGSRIRSSPNRFLLWGAFGLMATGINVASATGNWLGVDPSRRAARARADGRPRRRRERRDVLRVLPAGLVPRVAARARGGLSVPSRSLHTSGAGPVRAVLAQDARPAKWRGELPEVARREARQRAEPDRTREAAARRRR